MELLAYKLTSQIKPDEWLQHAENQWYDGFVTGFMTMFFILIIGIAYHLILRKDK